jgi:hypothetical protein
MVACNLSLASVGGRDARQNQPDCHFCAVRVAPLVSDEQRPNLHEADDVRRPEPSVFARPCRGRISVPVFFRKGAEPQELMVPFILCQTLHSSIRKVCM